MSANPGRRTAHCDTLIAGGGIAGLAAAIALARTGRAVTVAEQAGRFETAGAGLQLGPNAVRALQAIGAWEAVAPHVAAPDAIDIHDGVSGRRLKHLPLGAGFERRFGAPYRLIHRADLLNALLDVAKGETRAELHTALRLESLEAGAEETRCRFTDGSALTAATVIGADGVRSAVRAAILGDGPPRSHGQVIYRALCAMPAGAPASVRVWLCPRGHVVAYPVRGGSRLNIVAVTGSAWQGEGWSSPADPREVQAAFAGAAADVGTLIGRAAVWQKWLAADRDPAPRWSERNVLLIGDAAHPTLPYLAQGAAMALEDAAVLGSLAARTERLPAVFDRFEALRRQRTARLTLASRRQGTIDHLAGPARLARNLAIRAIPAGLHFARLRWVYEWQPPD